MELPILLDVAGLAFPEGESNAGGVRRLRLIPASQLKLIHPERFPFPELGGYADHTVSSQHLIFSAGASLSEIQVLSSLCSFSDDMETQPNGEVFKHLIQIIVPKVRLDVVAWVQKYKAVAWVAFLQDRNGFNRMAGTPDQPLRIAVTFGQPLGNGNNQTVLTFASSVEHPAYFISGIEDTDLLVSSPFDGAFGFAFDA
ncbi:hypothetical protein [Spirosoma endbachense]|uniref:Uncharacterized protein n=1 Tax=Spirosoma endbachense TaxID=2666025 RepID=A0A6P1VXW3_9BACT|nr:hypothetical protein [Spirosoma endbachense]QHV97963.1 hypothetical protein GJR95_24435 [Spirosoma endbachense]